MTIGKSSLAGSQDYQCRSNSMLRAETVWIPLQPHCCSEGHLAALQPYLASPTVVGCDVTPVSHYLVAMAVQYCSTWNEVVAGEVGE